MTTGPAPAYLALARTGELERRAQAALERLASCTLCPRACRVDRSADERGLCRTGRHAHVSACFPHFGEEDCLRGDRGSGTIFFSWCNLRCVFCQNWETSQSGIGEPVDARTLAQRMLGLQDLGCHNINLVTPEHVVPQLLEALPLAVAGGLRLPLVYNTSAYDAPESLALLRGIVDIYMPDFKVWRTSSAARWLGAKDYPEVARTAIKAMHAQVGDLLLDDRGVAVRGLLVRHLVMPDALEETNPIVRWLAEELGPDTYLNVMGQYRPEGRVLTHAGSWPALERPTTRAEYEAAVAAARAAGLRRLDERAPLPRRLRAGD
jgi:putative pyruvate formate lyase activating enzyme